MKAERIARWFAILIISGLLLGIMLVRSLNSGQAVEVHARMPEAGGWAPADLQAVVGQPFNLRLTSDDVLHSFAIGQSDQPPVDVKPGQMTELTLNFDQPGKFTYYCTRWCGPDHWRMRGTIEVQPDPNIPAAPSTPPDSQPLFVALGLDIDSPRHTERVPERRPDANTGALFSAFVPPSYLEANYYRTHSPADVWQALRSEPATEALNDQQVWDLAAWVWRASTTQQKLAEGQRLYARDCAACHGQSGAGDGVMAPAVAAEFANSGHEQSGPFDFTAPHTNLATSPAIQHGKIVRGGMGTGMPYWGPIFTDEQIWSLVDYLWTFQFDY